MSYQGNQRLEDLFVAIRDLKEQNFGLVGTKDLWDMIKVQQENLQRPYRLAAEINEEVKREVSQLTYHATPAQIKGIKNAVLCGINPEMKDPMDEQSFEIFAGGLVTIFTQPEFDRQKRNYRPIFLSANKARICRDEEIAPHIAVALNRRYKEYYGELSPDHTEEVLKMLRCVNWPEVFSERERKREEHEEYMGEVKRLFNYGRMIRRVEREQVESRLEYRRGILSHVLSEKYKNWESAVESWDALIISRKERYQRLVQVNAPETIIENEHNLIKDAVFIRRLPGQEKNWVEKVLRN